MATIQSQLRLNDGMSTVLRQVTAALDTCRASYEQMQATSRQAMDIGGITAAQVGLSEANAVIDDMAAGLRDVDNQQNRVNQTVRAGSGAFDGMLGKIGQMAAAYMSIQGMQNITNLSDNVASAQARLSLIVDDGGSVESLDAKIYASAQRSRGSYMSVLDTVSKLGLTAGDAFNGKDEIIQFAELMNKNFIIAGASASEQSNAMYQLNQAMAAGRLQGDEYRSIIENAPMLASSIEDYMRNVQGATGSMKDWASQGLLTADVIKVALFSSADEVEARFAEMPYTWARVWIGMGNSAILILKPLLTYLNDLANDPRAQGMVNGLLGSLNFLVVVAVPVIDFLVSGATMIAENWDMIAPVLLGLATAFLLLHGVQTAYNIVIGITNGLKSISAARTAMTTIAVGAETTATFAATAAQYGFNTALYACPLVWILIIIIAVIAAIYGIVAAINKFAGTSISATGIIFGVFYTLGAQIHNLVFVPWRNRLAAFANFIGNLFNDPVAAVKVLFLDMAQTTIGYIINVARAIESLINKIPGMQVNITAGMDDFYNQLESASQKVKDESGWIEYVSKADFVDYGQAWNNGYSAGQGVESSIGNMFNPNDLAGLADPNSALLDGMSNNLNDIANNTGSTASSLKTTNENMGHMRDIAEREAINRTTLAEIKVDMTGMTNRIDSSMDIDGVLSRFTDGVREALVTSAEGVHA